ncbi:glycosyltransferase family 1 [Opitutaceae bacterium TAV5]|nr:glycosyltransferase family 1 [Opitutaceae bacterium TAV5]
MKTSLPKTAFAAALAVFLGVVGACAQTIVNGSFDENLPTFSASGFVSQSPTGWGAVTVTPYWIQSWDGVDTAAAFKVAAEDGAAFVGLQNNASSNTTATGLYQNNITGLTAGETYTVSFYIRARNVQSEEGNFSANISGGTSVILVSNIHASSTAWTLITANFTAASASINLGFTFRGINSEGITARNDQMIFIDNVSITPAIPEPSTYALLAALAIGIACVIVRRRSLR